mgnify:CR=1 FL=1
MLRLPELKSYREGFESWCQLLKEMTNDPVVKNPPFSPTKPRVSKVPDSDWWLCKNNVTHGYGHTPTEAHRQWFAWLKLGVYDGRT